MNNTVLKSNFWRYSFVEELKKLTHKLPEELSDASNDWQWNRTFSKITSRFLFSNELFFICIVFSALVSKHLLASPTGGLSSAQLDITYSSGTTGKPWSHKNLFISKTRQLNWKFTGGTAIVELNIARWNPCW